jgi:streptogramin lyase
MRLRLILVLLAAVVAGCTDDPGGTSASPATTSTSSAPPSSVALSEPKLPAIQSVVKVGVSRIDPAKARVTGHVALPMTSDGESSIGVGEGAVWALIDGSSCRQCAVARIDPKTLKITNRYPLPGGASAVRAGLGGVWITSYQTDAVVRLDPSTAGSSPRSRSHPGHGSSTSAPARSG